MAPTLCDPFESITSSLYSICNVGAEQFILRSDTHWSVLCCLSTREQKFQNTAGTSVISYCQQVQANSSSLHGQLDGSWFFTNWWLSKSFPYIKVIHKVPQTGAIGPSFPKTGDKWKVRMRTVHKEGAKIKTKGLIWFSHLKLVFKGILPPVLDLPYLHWAAHIHSCKSSELIPSFMKWCPSSISFQLNSNWGWNRG